MSFTIQEWIHRLEVGKGSRIIVWFAMFLMFCTLVVVYNLQEFKNMKDPAAMDQAQVAQNIAEGNGFTTHYIRLLSVSLQNEHTKDPHLTGGHPDLENPPLYPLALAAAMKLAPTKSVEADTDRGIRYVHKPDLVITYVNQFLFFCVVMIVFYFADRMFDGSVAWLAALLVLGTDHFWKFTFSGNSTMLCMLWILGLAISIWGILEQTALENPRQGKIIFNSCMAGLFLGLCSLTRYPLLFLVFPVVWCIGMFGGARRNIGVLCCLLIFAGMVAPWMARNYKLSGQLLGTAGVAMIKQTPYVDSDTLERSVETQIPQVSARDYFRKVLVNSHSILQKELPRLGGSLLTGFFIVGLLVPFNNPALGRFRYFILFALATLLVSQALFKTDVSDKVPDYNQEQLLILLAPLIFVFGVALFFTLVDQIPFPFPALRTLLIVLVGMAISLPLLITILPPGAYPANYPPYFPPKIKATAEYVEKNELIMSDIPWAVAWYGNRDCVGVTQDPLTSYFELNYLRPVKLIYFTQVTTDEIKLRSAFTWMAGNMDTWPAFLWNVVLAKRTRDGFPLDQVMVDDFYPSQIIISDRRRWRRDGADNP